MWKNAGCAGARAREDKRDETGKNARNVRLKETPKMKLKENGIRRACRVTAHKSRNKV
jgi:hypothetical protein